MTRYRAALDARGDLEEISKWITEAKAQRLQAETDLHQATTKVTVSPNQPLYGRVIAAWPSLALIGVYVIWSP